MRNKQVAIITGASKGMGAACAKELAARHYHLVLFSPSGASELAKELDVLGVSGSVTSPDDLANLCQQTLDHFGRIDAVINSTGHPPQGDLLELTDQDWQTGMELTFLNVARMARLVTPIMLEQGKGAFVNISTYCAFEPNPDFPISAPMRAALAGYAKLYADRYANLGIRMNNLLPGFAESYTIDEKTRLNIPMQRSAKLSEIAKTAAFLLSDDAGYITGQNIRVDGGLSKSV